MGLWLAVGRHMPIEAYDTGCVQQSSDW